MVNYITAAVHLTMEIGQYGYKVIQKALSEIKNSYRLRSVYMKYVCTVISVADISAARKFYEELFGLEVYQDYEGISLLPAVWHYSRILTGW